MSDTPPVSPPTDAAAVPAGAGRLSVSAITSLALGILGFCTGGIAGLAGVVVGIIAITSIRKSNGAMRGTGLAIAGIVTSAISVPIACMSVGVLLPALAKARLNAQELKLHAQARVLGEAAMAYAAGSNGVLALDDWENTLVAESYITPEFLESPLDPTSGRCFAFNANADGLSLDDLYARPDLVLVFECVPGSPLTGGPELLWYEKGPRAGPVRSVIAFADGRTEVVPMEQYAELRWEP